ncbi:UNVERIFIED_CONTAM: hypothetical protein FKN15_008504 [Acipenser sinensis]
MDQWIRCNNDPSQTWWDDRLDDLLGGCEDQGWCLACGEVRCPFLREEEVLPAPKQKRRRGSRFHRQAREPVLFPALEREVLPAWAPESAACVRKSEMGQWIGRNPHPSQIWWDGGWEDLFEDLEDWGWCFVCGEFGHKVLALSLPR